MVELATKIVKGWCPSLEKPMITGDGMLVRVPIKFGRLKAGVARKIAELAEKYGNGHLDLSARGNLQIRGVNEVSYPKLRDELARLGFVQDAPLAIITNPLAGIDKSCDASVLQIAEELENFARSGDMRLPEKFLIVIDGGGVFPLTDIACDLYVAITPSPLEGEGWGGGYNFFYSSVYGWKKLLQCPHPNPLPEGEGTLEILANSSKCNKKPFSEKPVPLMLGYIPLAEQYGVVGCAAEFGRVEVEQLKKLADIAEKYSGGEIILAPKRIFLLPKIVEHEVQTALSELEKIGFITKNDDARLKIHACVGAPACSSALGDTRNYAKKYAIKNPNLDKIVHITGCAKGCAYHGKADITIMASKTGYD